jgi:integrase
MTAWAPEEVRTFLTCAADDRLFAAWRLLATCGLRRGEVLGLRWTDLNLRALTLRVDRSLVADPRSRVLVWQTPKTERSRRTIDLDAATVNALKSHRKQQASERLAAMGAWPDGDDQAADLVFADKTGQPIRPATFSRQFDALVKRAEVTRIRLHDLRHTAATLLLRAGVPVHVVSERLGHASTSITMDVYAHSLRDQRSGAADAIASAIDL